MACGAKDPARPGKIVSQRHWSPMGSCGFVRHVERSGPLPESSVGPESYLTRCIGTSKAVCQFIRGSAAPTSRHQLEARLFLSETVFRGDGRERPTPVLGRRACGRHASGSSLDFLERRRRDLSSVFRQQQRKPSRERSLLFSSGPLPFSRPFPDAALSPELCGKRRTR